MPNPPALAKGKDVVPGIPKYGKLAVATAADVRAALKPATDLFELLGAVMNNSTAGRGGGGGGGGGKDWRPNSFLVCACGKPLTQKK